jgi:hypothetical protein
LTTVPSINAMLDARIVAAKIHGSCLFAQGADDRRERMTASSQGSLITLGIKLARQTRSPVSKVMGHVRFGFAA